VKAKKHTLISLQYLFTNWRRCFTYSSFTSFDPWYKLHENQSS